MTILTTPSPVLRLASWRMGVQLDSRGCCTWRLEGGGARCLATELDCLGHIGVHWSTGAIWCFTYPGYFFFKALTLSLSFPEVRGRGNGVLGRGRGPKEPDRVIM